jgi:hypothetical protein
MLQRMAGIAIDMALCYGSDEDKKKKYRHPEFDDREIEGLAKYFRIDGYPNLSVFLQKLRHDSV